MKIDTFIKHLQVIENTTSRNEITIRLAKLLSEASHQEIDKICYLVLGRLLPKYQGLEFNLAEKTMIQIVASAFNKRPETIKKLFHQSGDLGSTAEQLRQQWPEPARNPQMADIYQQLLAIAREKGGGSQERKKQKMTLLMRAISPQANRYLVRIPIGKLRLGFSTATILDALSWLEKGDKSLRPQLQYAFNVSADIGRVAKWLKEKGAAKLTAISAQPGIPIMPALAEREVSLKKILERMNGHALLEPKYDGFRVQIHINHRPTPGIKQNLFNQQKPILLRIFSRSTKDITPMLPEVAKASRGLPLKSAILDGEAIGFNPKTQKFVTFQETTTRKRKYGIGQAAKDIPIRAFIFDILYYNGQTLIRKPFHRRRQILEQIFAANPRQNHLALTPQTAVTKLPKAERLFHRYINRGLEGVLIKEANSQYHAGQRKFSWIKFKRAMEGKLADSIDCLLMGYYYGRGKRQKFGLGALLVGTYSPKDGQFYTISKVGTGLSDKQWRMLHRRAAKLISRQKPKNYQVPKELTPDVWLAPGLVLEISADVISKSPLHSSKFALRFPRFQRLRDKSPTEITNLHEIRELFKIQEEENR